MREKEQKDDVEYLPEEDYINLSDLCMASALEFFGYKHVAINRDPKFHDRKVEFVYKKTKETEKIIESFWKEELKVDPKRFWDIVRALKARVKIY